LTEGAAPRHRATGVLSAQLWWRCASRGGSGWTQLQVSGAWAAAVVERRYRRSSRASRRCRLRLRPGGRRGRGALHRGVSGGGFVGPTICREESGGPGKENNWYKTGCGACRGWRVRATELGRRLGLGMKLLFHTQGTEYKYTIHIYVYT
jgi:hypothetical protein